MIECKSQTEAGLAFAATFHEISALHEKGRLRSQTWVGANLVPFISPEIFANSAINRLFTPEFVILSLKPK
jgi:hypothetical protein